MGKTLEKKRAYYIETDLTKAKILVRLRELCFDISGFLAVTQLIITIILLH